ncbi:MULTISPECIES: Phr family secreted Rap phosphatase inhibitor [Bacillus cereus group]|nr:MULTISPECIES: Phr family secreted Rap phosphatase inhibitor [Bacillus cereus group]MDA1887415.1 Phr family secreted Rap phosphatase inhibitor [Bacillus cereus group sp. BY105LC]MEB9504993.1 Phr family secreted Rap phosphatase inhibitor [Bacillus anthracis]
MKKLTGILMGLSLSAILSFGFTFSAQSENVKDSKSNTPVIQYSHADTW